MHFLIPWRYWKIDNNRGEIIFRKFIFIHVYFGNFIFGNALQEKRTF